MGQSMKNHYLKLFRAGNPVYLELTKNVEDDYHGKGLRTIAKGGRYPIVYYWRENPVILHPEFGEIFLLPGEFKEIENSTTYI